MSEGSRPPGYGRRNPDNGDPFIYRDNSMDAEEEFHRLIAEQRHRERLTREHYGRRMNKRLHGRYSTNEELDEERKFLLWYGLWFLAGLGVARLFTLPAEYYLFSGAVVGFIGGIVKRNGLEGMSLSEAVGKSIIEIIILIVAIIVAITA